MQYREERKEVAKFMRRLYKQKLTTASGGNVSLKNSDGYIFITASQTDKSCIKYKDIIVFDPQFNNITPELIPSMEYNMHLNIYKNRSDIKAIIHSHPVYASTFSISDIKIIPYLTGEANYVLGEISEIDYKLMGTSELAESCSEKLITNNTGILKNHGAITLGKTLFEAYDRMEVLEFYSKMYFNILMLNGNYHVLNKNEISEIEKMRNR